MSNHARRVVTSDALLEVLRFWISESNQIAVARRLEVSPQFINDVSRGRREISEELARKMGYEKPRRLRPDLRRILRMGTQIHYGCQRERREAEAAERKIELENAKAKYEASERWPAIVEVAGWLEIHPTRLFDAGNLFETSPNTDPRLYEPSVFCIDDPRQEFTDEQRQEINRAWVDMVAGLRTRTEVRIGIGLPPLLVDVGFRNVEPPTK